MLEDGPGGGGTQDDGDDAVAEHLGVGAWRIYQVCETGELPHVRINNSIRVRPKDLEQFIASRLTVTERRRPHRRKNSPE